MKRLNDDCLRIIIKLLNLKDQIAMFQVCQIFKNIIYEEWQTKYEILRYENSFSNVELNKYEISIFVTNICNAVRKAELNLPKETFEILKAHEFPNAYDLYFAHETLSLNDNEDIRILNKIFPNLRILKLNGLYNGKYISLWTQLDQIVLSRCLRLKYSEIYNIMSTMPLKSIVLDNFETPLKPLNDDAFANGCLLEKIVLNSFELGLLLSENVFQKLLNLKTLLITNEYHTENLEKLYILLGKFKSTKVVFVESRNINNILPSAIVMNFHTELRKISFIQDPMALTEMLKHVNNLPALMELKFFCCPINGESFLNLLGTCPNVDFIGVDHCSVTFVNMIINVYDIVQHRTKPLKINFFENRFVCSDQIAKLELNDGSNDLVTLSNQKTLPLHAKYLSICFDPNK